MNRYAKLVICICLVLVGSARASNPSPSPTPSPPPTPAVTSQPTPEASADARNRVLELAGAFSNDGYEIRDGYWFGTLDPLKPKFIEVNLFAGNEYWFSVAAVSPARKISVTVIDEKGSPIHGESYENGAVAAAGDM